MAAALVFAITSRAGAEALSAGQTEFFEKNIRPVLIQRCYECHSVEKGKSKGGLALDSRDAVLKGGDTGPALVPGQPDKSLLIESVRYKNHDLQMPPKGALQAREVSLLEEWVRMGAPDPRASTPAAATAHAPRVIDIAQGSRSRLRRMRARSSAA